MCYILNISNIILAQKFDAVYGIIGESNNLQRIKRRTAILKTHQQQQQKTAKETIKPKIILKHTNIHT